MGVKQVGLKATGGQSQPRHGQEIRFSANAETIEWQIRRK
jgi:hypothetical protein